MQGNTIFLAQNLGKFEDDCTKNTRNFLFSRAYSVLNFTEVGVCRARTWR